jgi:uncharacterized protein YjgD (DUF1641 family)
VGNFNTMLDTLGSVMDLMKDVGPIANEVIIDTTKTLHEFEQKGYFEFMKEFGAIIDNIVTHYSINDVRMLADNVVTILDTVKNLTQPDMLKSIDTAVKVFGNMETENVPEFSIFSVMREINKPEMKKAWGFLFTFLKNMTKNDVN